MVATTYNDNMGTTDGVAFDTLTGLMIVTPEFQDLAYVINMSEYVASSGTVPQHFTSRTLARPARRSAKARAARSRSTC